MGSLDVTRVIEIVARVLQRLPVRNLPGPVAGLAVRVIATSTRESHGAIPVER